MPGPIVRRLIDGGANAARSEPFNCRGRCPSRLRITPGSRLPSPQFVRIALSSAAAAALVGSVFLPSLFSLSTRVATHHIIAGESARRHRTSSSKRTD